MKISATKFQSNHHGFSEAGSDTHGFYKHQNIDVYNQIIINGQYFDAVYQTGCNDDFGGDYRHPSCELELSEEGGANEMLCYIDAINTEEFGKQKVMDEHLEHVVSDFFSAIKTIEDLKEIHEFLIKNKPKVSDYERQEEEEEEEKESNRIKMISIVGSLPRDELEKLTIMILEREKGLIEIVKDHLKLTPREKLYKEAKETVDEMFAKHN